jgi:hypothetical protein
VATFISRSSSSRSSSAARISSSRASSTRSAKGSSSVRSSGIKTSAKAPPRQGAAKGHSSRDIFQAAPKGKSAQPASKGKVRVQTPAERKQILKNTLRPSATGSATVKYLEKNKVPIDFKKGQGTVHSNGRIQIDTKLQRERAAEALVHEGHHAKAKLSGHGGNIRTQSRGDYVNLKLREEASATAAEFQTKRELRAAGRPVSPATQFEKGYEAARSRARGEYLRTNATVNPKEMNAVTDRAGYNFLLNGFKGGAVRTNQSNSQYPAYYGEQWDKANGK